MMVTRFLPAGPGSDLGPAVTNPGARVDLIITALDMVLQDY